LAQTRDTSLPPPEELQILLLADVLKAAFDQFLDFVGCLRDFADEVVVFFEVHELRVAQRVVVSCAEKITTSATRSCGAEKILHTTTTAPRRCSCRCSHGNLLDNN